MRNRVLIWAAGAALMVTSAAIAGTKSKNDWWHGRVTPTSPEHASILFAMNQPSVQAVVADRFKKRHYLTDIGANIEAEEGGGWMVEVLFNFERVSGPTHGDVLAFVLTGYDGTPLELLLLQDPAPVDETIIWAGGPDAMTEEAYFAIGASYADGLFDFLLQESFEGGLELYGTKTTILSETQQESVVEVECTFLFPDASPAPPGYGFILAQVRVDHSTGDCVVEFVWSE